LKELVELGVSLFTHKTKSQTHLYEVTYYSVLIPSKGWVILGLHKPLDEKDPTLCEIGFGQDFHNDYLRMIDPSTSEDERFIFIVEYLIENYSNVPFSSVIVRSLAKVIIEKGLNDNSEKFRSVYAKLRAIVDHPDKSKIEDKMPMGSPMAMPASTMH